MDPKLLDILACPRCKGKLAYDKNRMELVCKFDKLAYPIVDDIPVMLENKARRITEQESP